MTIGMKIRKRRNELKLTQEQLGEKLGITKSAICKVERDKEQNLTTERVETFAEALDCSVQYLMGWEDSSVTKSDSSIKGEKDATLLIKFHQLSDIDQDKVLDFIDELILKSEV